MTKTWQLQKAQSRFPELVGEALKGQPQVIMRYQN
jgi:hypothetical protein